MAKKKSELEKLENLIFHMERQNMEGCIAIPDLDQWAADVEESFRLIIKLVKRYERKGRNAQRSSI